MSLKPLGIQAVGLYREQAALESLFRVTWLFAQENKHAVLQSSLLGKIHASKPKQRIMLRPGKSSSIGSRYFCLALPGVPAGRARAGSHARRAPAPALQARHRAGNTTGPFQPPPTSLQVVSWQPVTTLSQFRTRLLPVAGRQAEPLALLPQTQHWRMRLLWFTLRCWGSGLRVFSFLRPTCLSCPSTCWPWSRIWSTGRRFCRLPTPCSTKPSSR